MTDKQNNPEPMSDEQIDKIFGMSTPDFSGGEDHTETRGEDGMITCCNYHFLQWLATAIKDGVDLSQKERDRAVVYLGQAAAVVMQVEDDEEGVDPMTAALVASLEKGGLDNIATSLKKLSSGVLYEGVTEGSTLTIQLLVDGVRLKAGGKSLRVRPVDSVILAGTIGGLVWDSDRMRKVFLRALQEGKKVFDEGGLDTNDDLPKA